MPIPAAPTGPRTGRPAVIVLAAALLLASCRSPSVPDSRTEFLLGTTITVTTYGHVANGVLDEVFLRVKEIEERMSTSEDDYSDTELLRVNAASGREAVTVSADTFEVIDRALEFSERSGGLFDVSIHPLVRLWGIGTENASVPDRSEVDTARALVDFSLVQTDRTASSVFLPKAGMGLDVGGIAKGYAADEAARILVEAGVESALLDFGGNILTVGRKPDRSDWRIGIQSPDASRGQFLGIASVVGQSLVTSGIYERFFEENGRRYHHILDTGTGYPVENGLAGVTIVSPSSIEADALSTAVFAMGLDAGLKFAESLPDVEAILVTSDRGVYFTSGVPAFFELTNGEFEIRS